MNDHYWLSSGSDQRGPFTLCQLQGMWRSGSITADAFYFTEGLDEWAPISILSVLLDPPAPTAQPPALSQSEHQVSPNRKTQQQAVVRIYKGSQSEATAAFQKDAVIMAAHGYVPTSQTWTPGEYGCGSFLVALLLCLLVIGILVFIYMLIVKPPGTLTVTYEYRGA